MIKPAFWIVPLALDLGKFLEIPFVYRRVLGHNAYSMQLWKYVNYDNAEVNVSRCPFFCSSDSCFYQYKHMLHECY
jgi:hypothetical protein